MSIQTIQQAISVHASGEDGYISAIEQVKPLFQASPEVTPDLFGTNLSKKQKVVLVGGYFTAIGESTPAFFAGKAGIISAKFGDIDYSTDDVEGHLTELEQAYNTARSNAQMLADKYGKTGEKVTKTIMDLITDELQTAFAHAVTPLSLEQAQIAYAKLGAVLDGVKLKAYESEVNKESSLVS